MYHQKGVPHALLSSLLARTMPRARSRCRAPGAPSIPLFAESRGRYKETTALLETPTIQQPQAASRRQHSQTLRRYMARRRSLLRCVINTARPWQPVLGRPEATHATVRDEGGSCPGSIPIGRLVRTGLAGYGRAESSRLQWQTLVGLVHILLGQVGLNDDEIEGPRAHSGKWLESSPVGDD
jgi:hypothetical protein